MVKVCFKLRTGSHICDLFFPTRFIMSEAHHARDFMYQALLLFSTKNIGKLELVYSGAWNKALS